MLEITIEEPSQDDKGASRIYVDTQVFTAFKLVSQHSKKDNSSLLREMLELYAQASGDIKVRVRGRRSRP